MLMKIWLLLLLLFLVACSENNSSSVNPADFKVAVVTVFGPEDDKGFNEFSIKGARDAAQGLGLSIETFNTPLPDNAFFNNILLQDFDLVIPVGFGWGDAVKTFAPRFPDVSFAIIDVLFDDYSTLPNVTSLVFREDQAGFLAGALAGCYSQTGIVAVIGGIEAVPPVKRFVEGFANGARYARSDITALKDYLNSFSDTALARERANLLIAQGADVLFTAAGGAGVGALTAANAANIAGIGVDTDQYLSLPAIQRSIMTSAEKDVEFAASEAVRSWFAGVLLSGPITYSVRNNGLRLSPFRDFDSRISSKCKDLVRQVRTDLASGALTTGVQ
jgi:basic membrane lipoprotein Med (substrate-binding protein (PBP1-ABC) superfamily)